MVQANGRGDRGWAVIQDAVSNESLQIQMNLKITVGQPQNSWIK